MMEGEKYAKEIAPNITQDLENAIAKQERYLELPKRYQK